MFENTFCTLKASTQVLIKRLCGFDVYLTTFIFPSVLRFIPSQAVTQEIFVLKLFLLNRFLQ